MNAILESGLTKQRIVSELTKSKHGDLKSYEVLAATAARTEGEFFAHLISWNQKHGQIRDSKIALPVLSLTAPEFDGELAENSVAHLALLDPISLERAFRFSREVKVPRRKMEGLVTRYLRVREENYPRWERAALQHRDAMRALYALSRTKPATDALNACLFGRNLDKSPAHPPAGSLFDVVRKLKDMTPQEAAGTIMRRRVPFLVAQGAMGSRMKDPDVLLALIRAMSPAELVNNTATLKRFGIDQNPVLRSAYAEGLSKVSDVNAKGPKAATLKTTRAAEALEKAGDQKAAQQLRGAQEKQLDAKGVEGDWLVLGDKSSSMNQSIELARQISSTLARMVKGRVHLVFFDSMPYYVDVTGKTYDEILKQTSRVTANGMTGAGCGLWALVDKGVRVDGIAIVSDGGENQTPAFCQAYQYYEKKMGESPPVYLYHVPGERNGLSPNCAAAGVDVQVFEIDSQTDYYSIPNLVLTMNTRRYGLVEQIMDEPLLTLDEVFKKEAA